MNKMTLITPFLLLCFFINAEEETTLLSNPLNFTTAYSSSEASFTIPKNILIENGDIHFIDPAMENRKKQLIHAISSVDQAVITIEGDSYAINLSEDNPTDEDEVFSNPMVLTSNTLKFPYVELRDHLQMKFISSKSISERNAIRSDLARLNITFKRYPEAIAILEQLPQNEKISAPEKDEDRILYGMALALNGEKERALPLLTQSGEPRSHRLLWRAYATDDINTAKTLFKQHNALIKGYPPVLDELLTRSYAETLIEDPEHTEEVITLFSDLASRLNGQDLQPETLYILSKAYELLGEQQKALRLLADVAESGESPIAYQAKYDFVTNLQKTGNLTNTATINALETLSRFWRGDKLEEQILLDLGRLYLSEKDFRKALNNLKDYAQYYPDGKSTEEVAFLMTQNFLSAFNSKTALMTDDLGFLSLYYDFRELTPADKRGDRLITQVASRLERLNLFKQAEELYNQQLRYRVDTPQEKALITLSLARLYIKDYNPKGAVELLSTLNIENLPIEEREKASVLKAEALYKTGKTDEAKNLLKTLKTDDARNMLVEVYWKETNAKALIALLRPMFTTGEHNGFENEIVRDHFTKLAYAYATEKQFDDIRQLKKDFPNVIRDYANIADAIAFAMAKGGAKDVITTSARPVARLASELSNINKISESYHAIATDVQERKKERQLFNNKMRYLEMKEQGRL